MIFPNSHGFLADDFPPGAAEREVRLFARNLGGNTPHFTGADGWLKKFLSLAEMDPAKLPHGNSINLLQSAASIQKGIHPAFNKEPDKN
jgi:hypothetical protein